LKIKLDKRQALCYNIYMAGIHALGANP